MVCAVGAIGVVGIIGFPLPSLSTGGNWPFEGVGVGDGAEVLVGVGLGSTGVGVGSGVGEKEGVGNVGGLLRMGATPAGFFFFFGAQPSTEPKTTNTVNNSDIHFSIIFFSSTTISTSVKSIYSYSTRNIGKLFTCGLHIAKNVPIPVILNYELDIKIEVHMSLTKTELRKQLKAIGISVENDCVRKSEIHKILSDTNDTKLSHEQAHTIFRLIGNLSSIAKELQKEDFNKKVLIQYLDEIINKLDVWAKKMV